MLLYSVVILKRNSLMTGKTATVPTLLITHNGCLAWATLLHKPIMQAATILACVLILDVLIMHSTVNICLKQISEETVRPVSPRITNGAPFPLFREAGSYQRKNL